MKLPNPYQCDREGCTVTKAKSNGWWLVYSPDGANDFSVKPWDVDHVDDTGVKHLCSENCVLVMLGGWMAEMHRKPVMAVEAERGEMNRAVFAVVALALAGISLVGCHRVKHERRTLAMSGVGNDGCLVIVWDLGEEFSRIDRRAWATRVCMDGSTQETEIDHGEYFRGKSPAVWTLDGTHIILDVAPIIRFRKRKP